MPKNPVTKVTISTTITVVDAPMVSLSEHEKAGDALLKFYRALGWNGNDYLDPCKVRTTNAIYNRLHDVIYNKCPDPVGVGMLMVNRGPGTDDFVPPGKVYLYKGWVTPFVAEEGASANEA
jgi:hypothetical protein